MNSENKVNEKVYNLYVTKVEQLNGLKNRLLANIGLGTEDNLDLALKIFRTRYDVVARDDGVAKNQAIHTSNTCLKAVFGDVISNWDAVDLLEGCDKLTCHVRELERLIHDESAILIGDYETIGTDDVPVIGIGHVAGGIANFYAFSNTWFNKLDGYIDSEWMPDKETEEKCMKYWEEHSMI